jgi:hypothetical protein
MMEMGPALLDHLAEDQLHWLFAQRRIAVEIAKGFSAQCPHVSGKWVSVILTRSLESKKSSVSDEECIANEAGAEICAPRVQLDRCVATIMAHAGLAKYQ